MSSHEAGITELIFPRIERNEQRSTNPDFVGGAYPIENGFDIPQTADMFENLPFDQTWEDSDSE